MLAVLARHAPAPRARAPAGVAARATNAPRASHALSPTHRSRAVASAPLRRTSAALHHASPRGGADISRVDAAARVEGRVIGIARRAGIACRAGSGVDASSGAVADDDDAPAAWLADDDDAEVCAAAFEVKETALRSLCHGNAAPPACTHDYWRARGWKARPRDWERWAGTAWECKDAWPADCVADDDGDDAAKAAGAERARAAHAMDAQKR